MEITGDSIQAFKHWLINEEKRAATIQKYVRIIKNLMLFLSGREICKELILEWKDSLITSAGLSPKTVNSYIAAFEAYCRFAEINIRLKYHRVQKKMFNDESKNITKEEYNRLIKAAVKDERTALVIETIGATGIRVSELKFITFDAALRGSAVINLKGKVRTVLIPGKLCRKLIKYAKRHSITGEIFVTKSGKSLSRKYIWQKMKTLCKKAGVDKTKVFPHNLRHLFARLFYKTTRNLAYLADILGHSSIETTRIYLVTGIQEHAKMIESMGMV
ncbi:MAG: tyrosine-type recombinase/integrase [Clostridiales bacterium]|nr:tyrosine-type recombinase/integrase [Clostridiales bacterium]